MIVFNKMQLDTNMLHEAYEEENKYFYTVQLSNDIKLPDTKKGRFGSAFFIR